jgi:hypothetical protein
LFAIYQDTATLICLLVPEGHSNGQCSPESNQDVNTSKEAAPLARTGKLILAISDTCTLNVMASHSLCSLSSSGSLSRPSHERSKLTIKLCIIDIPFHILCIGGKLRNTQQDSQDRTKVLSQNMSCMHGIRRNQRHCVFLLLQC